MTARPNKRYPRNRPKIRRGPVGQISQEEVENIREEIARLKRKVSERWRPFYNPPIFGRPGKPLKAPKIPEQPQRGWTAQPAEQQPQPQPQRPYQNLPDDMGGLWKAMVRLMAALLAFIVFIIILANLPHNVTPYDGGDVPPYNPPDDGNVPSGCPVTCEGYSGTQIMIAPQCECPSDSRFHHTIPSTSPYNVGYHWCTCN